MNPKLFSLIKTIVNDWDPAGLLEIHCPDDEYHSEIRAIATYIKLNENFNDEQLGIYLYKMFIEYLGDQFEATHEKCREISQLIIRRMKDNK